MMRLGRIFSVFCVVTALGAAGAALADIKGFNAAVKAGDYRTAAAEAKTAWPAWDKTDPDTAIVAREFGFASYVAGDYAAAREYGVFLRDNGKSLPTPDDQPASSAVLLAAAEFRLGASDATRGALFNALKAREGRTGIDNLSVLAAEALYKHDWAKGEWAKANESAGVAWRLLDRAGAQLALRALDARATHATAGFFSGPDKQDYENVVDAHDAVVDALNAEDNPQKRTAFAPLKYQLEAWSLSMIRYFHSGQQTGSNIPIRVKERELKRPEAAIFPGIGLTGDQCTSVRGDFDHLQYPQSAMYLNMVGTVIMKLDLDSRGQVIKGEVLAAAPAGRFTEDVEKALPRVVFQPGEGSKPGCDLSRTDFVLRIMFGRL